jgi:diphthine synthase
MLYLIGIGLKPKHLTLEAKEALEKCSAVFLEAYTSKYSEGTLKELERLLEKRVMKLTRQQIEENTLELLMQGKRENIALLVFGNALTATTHIQVLLDAKKLGIKTMVVPGISVTNFIAKTGLDEYRFGRTTTIVFHEENYAPESFYDVIEKNKSIGLHTLCLLDIQAEKGKMMSIGEALQVIEKIEKKSGKGLVKNSALIALCGAGSEDEIIKAMKFNKLKRSGFGAFPQSLIVCAELNEKEKEALEALKNA